MNPFELFSVYQRKMNDPNFANQFNYLTSQLNSIPGLQQEVIRIFSISDPRKRQKAIDRLPNNVKDIVGQLFNMLTS